MAFLFVLPTWPVEAWIAAMRKVAPDLDVRVWPDKMGRIEDIEYCAAWLPPPGVVKSLPNLPRGMVMRSTARFTVWCHSTKDAPIPERR